MTKIADTMQDDGSILHNQGPWGGRSGGGNGNNGNNGGNSGGQNPWGQRPNRPDQDPDLDDVLRQAQDRFKSAFGDRGTGGNPFNPGKAILAGIGIAAALWLSTGFYRVLPEEDAVIMTFGKWTSTRDESGLGYALPWPIQEVNKVNVGFDRRVEVGFREQTSTKNTRAAASSSDVPFESLMLTGDENIIDINFVVLWRISDAGKYLFKIRDPETTIKKVSESAMREIIGQTEIQKALNEARGQVETDTKVLIQKILDEYQAGVTINSVQLLRVDPPEQVVDAFDDVQRAKADKERLKNEAETYRNDIVPKARGEAQKTLQDAEAYKASVVDKATGDAERFISVYKAYAESKDVTQKRIYLETMQQVLANTKKVIVSDEKGTPVLPYLSLDGKKN